MSEENTLQQGGGEALPAAATPTNDVQAAQAAQAAAQAEPQEHTPKPEPKRNRTGEYIDRLKSELAEWRAGTRKFEAPQPQQQRPQVSDEPTLEQHNFDPVAFQRAHSDWAVQKALRADREARQQEEARRQQESLQISYTQRVGEFAEAHPDFYQSVARMPPLPQATEAAIMAHEDGPAIAYHLATTPNDMLALAATPPQYVELALQQLASRMTAAQQAPQTQPLSAKPVSQAPPPVQTVKGKTPTKTPDEKLTDAEWFRRRKEQRRAS